MQAISQDDIVRRIQAENPWWSQRNINPTYRGMKPRPYLDLFLMLMKEPVRRAVVLMGPRRVGKTVMIHHAIQALLESGTKAGSICYISLDSPVYNGLGLEKLLEYYQLASGISVKTETSCIFFDEIQYLRDWEVHLKSVVDTYENLKCIASGSSAAALRLKSQESGAGRFTNFLLPPLTFFEFVDLQGKTQELIDAEAFEDAKYGTGFIDLFSIASKISVSALNEEFIRYLNYGGYPEAVFSEPIQADPARFIKSDIIDKVLLRDLPSLYGIEDIQELNSLFTTLAFNTASEISLQELAQNSGVAKNTIKRYIEYLEAAFLIKTVHRLDHNARRFRRANFFKVYLANPSMRAALFSTVREDDPAIGHLAETAVFAQWFHSEYPLNYARWSEGEVDIVALGPEQKAEWAVEVKWSDRFADDAQRLSGLVSFMRQNRLDSALVTSRSVSRDLKVEGKLLRFAPVSVYCFTVGYNLMHGRTQQRLTGTGVPAEKPDRGINQST